MAEVVIRAELPSDYAAIAALHVRAFGQRAGEALVVALLRQFATFDPDLSLVAIADRQVVGHVLFTPQTIRLLGADVAAVNLAPIGIDPGWQKQGIGGRLIAAGHSLAQERGYALSFLLGHTSYYPRYGYQTYAYGSSELTVASRPALERLTARGPTEADLPTLHALWRHEEGAVDLAVVPGPDLLDWLSPNPAIETLVWQQADRVVGYTRSDGAQPTRPRMFLAQDHASARLLVDCMAERAGAAAELVLPVHPYSASAAAFGMPTVRAWEAAMVFPFGPGLFDEYAAQVRAGTRWPGRVTWPAAFDLV